MASQVCGEHQKNYLAGCLQMNTGAWQRLGKSRCKKLVRDISLQTTYMLTQNQEERQSAKLNCCLSRVVTSNAAAVCSMTNS